ESRNKATKTKPVLNISDLQPLARDFAFVVESGCEARTLINAAAGADKNLIAGVNVFDIFEGPSLGENKKSIAIEVLLQPKEKTLTDEEISAVSDKIVSNVCKATGGSLRG
ncbi:MAG: phenylalanine--tRNA ligase subunit beta, partial [Pseudomonadota bacterium]